MTPRPQAADVDPTVAKPDPEQCPDCAARGFPPVAPVLTKATDKQRDFKCARCGHVYILGLPASTYPTPGRSARRGEVD